MTLFFQAHLLPHIKNKEGGYTNDPKDRGGETNHGITIGVARENGYTGPMKNLPWDPVAVTIYEQEYYIKPGFVRIEPYSVRVAEELFDTGVNMGQEVAVTMFRRALNVLNRNEADYPDVPVASVVGPKTEAAFAAFMRRNGKTGETVMMRVLNGLQVARYVDITEGRPINERYTNGWIAQRIGDL